MRSSLIHCLPFVVAFLIFANVATAQDAAKADEKKYAPPKVEPPTKVKKVFKWPTQCLVCNSVDHDNCNNWLGFNYIRNCSMSQHGVDPSKPITCRKITQSVYGEARVIRQCSNEVADGCLDRVGTMKIKVRYCHCSDKDNCNAATRLGQGAYAQLVQLMLPLISSAALMKWAL